MTRISFRCSCLNEADEYIRQIKLAIKFRGSARPDHSTFLLLLNSQRVLSLLDGSERKYVPVWSESESKRYSSCVKFNLP